MKYACLSDIHGNIEAFHTCIKDAVEKGVNGFILVGDYITDFPFENETIEMIQELEQQYPCYIIKGNREDSVIHQSENHEYKIGSNEESIYYTAFYLTKAHINYLKKLPDVITENFGHYKVSISHKMEQADEADVIISGHTHLQSSIYDEGVLYVNPGSVGENADGRLGATYSIITFGEKVEVEENIVEYDREKVVAQLRDSYMSHLRDHWGELNCKTIENGYSMTLNYLKNMITIAENHGYSNDLDEVPPHLWNEGFELTMKQMEEMKQKSSM